jgi:hypothetical protein
MQRLTTRMLSFAVGTVMCFGYSCVAQSTAPYTCLSYEPAVVKVGGTLTRKTFPGPPNYDSIGKGDRAETYWFVELHSPACVAEDKSDPDLNPSQDRIIEVQLILDPTAYKTDKGLMGRDVIVSGTLFGAHTGHHHTPVLLTVKSIEAAR